MNGNGAIRNREELDHPADACRATIHGGREDGYRFYSSKTAPQPGQWRVNIASADGRAIGRVRFSVEIQAVPPAVRPRRS